MNEGSIFRRETFQAVREKWREVCERRKYSAPLFPPAEEEEGRVHRAAGKGGDT